MKYFLFIAFAFFLESSKSISSRHMKLQEEKNESKKGKKQLSHHVKYEQCKDDSDYVLFSGHRVHKNIVFFKEIEFMSCTDFLDTAINDFYLFEDTENAKNCFLAFSPSEIWDTLHNEEKFNPRICFFLDKNYTKSEFIIIYEARLAIELLLFALDHTGTIKFPYKYNNKISLKEIMKKLNLFIAEKEEILIEVLTQKDISDLKKFFQKYSDISNNFTFLNELQDLLKILNILGLEPGEATGARQKISIFTRFNKFF